jgi:hypothetical protein
MKAIVILALVAIVASTVVGQAGAQALETRSAAVPHLSVEITVWRLSGGRISLDERFHTDDSSRHSVYCIDGFSDMKYTLKDSQGSVILSSPKGGFDLVAGGGGTPVGPGHVANPCSSVQVGFQQRRVLLSDLYPNLPHGTYSLTITLAPRSTAEKASAQPITLSL